MNNYLTPTIFRKVFYYQIILILFGFQLLSATNKDTYHHMLMFLGPADSLKLENRLYVDPVTKFIIESKPSPENILSSINIAIRGGKFNAKTLRIPFTIEDTIHIKLKDVLDKIISEYIEWEEEDQKPETILIKLVEKYPNKIYYPDDTETLENMYSPFGYRYLISNEKTSDENANFMPLNSLFVKGKGKEHNYDFIIPAGDKEIILHDNYESSWDPPPNIMVILAPILKTVPKFIKALSNHIKDVVADFTEDEEGPVAKETIQAEKPGTTDLEQTKPKIIDIQYYIAYKGEVEATTFIDRYKKLKKRLSKKIDQAELNKIFLKQSPLNPDNAEDKELINKYFDSTLTINKVTLIIKGENEIKEDSDNNRLKKNKLRSKIRNQTNLYACFYMDTLKLMNIISPEIKEKLIILEAEDISNRILKELYKELDKKLLNPEVPDFAKITPLPLNKNDPLTFKLRYPANNKKLFIKIPKNEYFEEIDIKLSENQMINKEIIQVLIPKKTEVILELKNKSIYEDYPELQYIDQYSDILLTINDKQYEKELQKYYKIPNVFFRPHYFEKIMGSFDNYFDGVDISLINPWKLFTESFENNKEGNILKHPWISKKWNYTNVNQQVGKSSIWSGDFKQDIAEISYSKKEYKDGKISFYYDTKSVDDSIMFTFSFNNKRIFLPQTESWKKYEIDIPAGSYIFKWEFINMSENSSNSAWLDNIVFPPLKEESEINVIEYIIKPKEKTYTFPLSCVYKKKEYDIKEEDFTNIEFGFRGRIIPKSRNYFKKSKKGIELKLKGLDFAISNYDLNITSTIYKAINKTGIKNESEIKLILLHKNLQIILKEENNWSKCKTMRFEDDLSITKDYKTINYTQVNLKNGITFYKIEFPITVELNSKDWVFGNREKSHKIIWGTTNLITKIIKPATKPGELEIIMKLNGNYERPESVKATISGNCYDLNNTLTFNLRKDYNFSQSSSHKYNRLINLTEDDRLDISFSIPKGYHYENELVRAGISLTPTQESIIIELDTLPKLAAIFVDLSEDPIDKNNIKQFIKDNENDTYPFVYISNGEDKYYNSEKEENDRVIQKLFSIRDYYYVNIFKEMLDFKKYYSESETYQNNSRRYVAFYFFISDKTAKELLYSGNKERREQAWKNFAVGENEIILIIRSNYSSDIQEIIRENRNIYANTTAKGIKQ